MKTYNQLFEQLELSLNQLKSGPIPSPGNFSYRDLDKKIFLNHILKLALNENNDLSLWIGSSDTINTQRVIWESRGIKAKQSQDGSGVTSSWIVIEAENLYTPSIFISLATSICTKCIEQKSTKRSTVCAALEEWREMFLKNTDGLSLNELAGLIGELITLEEITKVHGATALDTWHGFEGECHDFSRNNFAIETKTKISVGRDISINGINQLEPPSDGKLFLRFLRLETTSNQNQLSLSSLVDSICKLGVSQGRLQENILKAGASINQITQSSNYFSVLERATYEVDEGFPRITKNSFKNNECPHGVSGLKYHINLSDAENYKVSDTTYLELIKKL
jgi:hypothetical protein